MHGPTKRSSSCTCGECSARALRCGARRLNAVAISPASLPIYRRSATLRDIASLLHMREPSLSSPLSHHAFRIVYYDAQSRAWSAREAGSGVTLMERSTFEDVLDSVYTETIEEDKDGLFSRTIQRTRPQMPNEADEDASLRTLNALQLADGEILDCVITSFPSKTGKRIRGIGEERSNAGYANHWVRARVDHPDRTVRAR